MEEHFLITVRKQGAGQMLFPYHVICVDMVAKSAEDFLITAVWIRITVCDDIGNIKKQVLRP